MSEETFAYRNADGTSPDISLIDPLAVRQVTISMTNLRGNVVEIDLTEIRRWLRWRHPILWRHNPSMRAWFSEMLGES